jgi:SNF2 family DNA or RNA helicase
VTLLVAQLQNILKPFLLRRCKKDVIKDLPLKKEYHRLGRQTALQTHLTAASVISFWRAVSGAVRTYLLCSAVWRPSLWTDLA